MAATRHERYDVAVMGGGAAGIAAAAGARRCGARTLLVERYGFLGGAATNANVLSYCGFFAQGASPRPMVRGIGGEVLDDLGALGLDIAARRAPSGNWIVLLDAEAVKLAFDRLARRDVIDCRLHCMLTSARRQGGQLEAVVLHDHAGPIDVEAAAFVDASGDADLAFAAGVPDMRDAQPERMQQAASFPVRIGGIASDVTIDAQALPDLVARIPADAATAAIRATGGHFIRLPWSQELWWMGINVVTDGLDSADLARGERAARELAWRFVALLRERIPGCAHAFVAGTGPQLGIRDSRQALPRYVMTAADVLSGRLREDGVARGCWPAEVHDPQAGPRFQAVGGEGYFDIPLAAIRASGADNLWLAGRTIGCEPDAYGSVRVMGTAFATGHAAGIAAAQLAGGSAPEDAPRVRRILLEQGALV